MPKDTDRIVRRPAHLALEFRPSTFANMLFTAADIARHVNGEVTGDPSITITGFAPTDTAKAGDLTFAENEEYFSQAENSAAAAILVSSHFASTRKVLIRVTNARVAFAKVLPLFFPELDFPAAIHPTAQIAVTARVDPSAHIGPFCVVGERVRIGPRSVLEGGNHLGADCV